MKGGKERREKDRPVLNREPERERSPVPGVLWEKAWDFMKPSVKPVLKASCWASGRFFCFISWSNVWASTPFSLPRRLWRGHRVPARRLLFTCLSMPAYWGLVIYLCQGDRTTTTKHNIVHTKRQQKNVSNCSKSFGENRVQN